ncbi:hypothetical protein WKW79_01980 [Variovorax robiniae]|uniref:Cobalt-zinc-cadmium resistance protein n=1 Tax=Variovorax robiniae TaxID=1836199 RepID=A0ABU8X0I6_9BURK
MRRLLLVFLMLLMPLQTVWSAAASVCMHEETTTRHFGHHDPHHDEAITHESAPDATGGEPGGEPGIAKAMDTDHHHVLGVNPVPHILALPTPLAGARRDPPDPADSFHSALIASLERPPQASADSRRQGF